MLRGYIYIIASALIFGCMPLGAKLIYADGVNSLSLVFLRNLFVLPVLAALIKLRGQSLKINPKALPGVVLVAVMGCCVTPLLLFQSYQYMASGTATVFHFVYPAAVALGGMLFMREKTNWKRLLCVALCTLGICLFYNPGDPIDPTGAGLALLSGVTYASYILLLTVFQNKSLSGFRFTFYVTGISAVVMGLVCLCSGQMMLPTSLKGWVMCAVFSVAICIGAVALFQEGTHLIGAQRASILSTVEPITSIVVGIVVFSEPTSLRTVLGSCLVVLASILIAVFDMREQKKAEKEKRTPNVHFPQGNKVGVGMTQTGNQSNAPHKHVNVPMGCITYSLHYPLALTFAAIGQWREARGSFCSFADGIAID